MSSKKKVVIRGKKTFPKNIADLTSEVLKLMEEHYFVLPLDVVIRTIGKGDDPDELDAIEVVLILEDEYGVYLEDFDSMKSPYTMRDVVADLAKKLDIGE